MVHATRGGRCYRVRYAWCKLNMMADMLIVQEVKMHATLDGIYMHGMYCTAIYVCYLMAYMCMVCIVLPYMYVT